MLSTVSALKYRPFQFSKIVGESMHAFGELVCTVIVVQARVNIPGLSERQLERDIYSRKWILIIVAIISDYFFINDS